jgi:hypothetical protein
MVVTPFKSPWRSWPGWTVTPPTRTGTWARPARDEARRAEGLVRGAHHLAERGADGGIVEVLEDDHRRAREFAQGGRLVAEARVGLAPGWSIRAERRGRGVADHRRKLREARSDPPVHEAGVPGPDVEQLDHVAYGRRIMLAQERERFLGQAFAIHDLPLLGSV